MALAQAHSTSLSKQDKIKELIIFFSNNISISSKVLNGDILLFLPENIATDLELFREELVHCSCEYLVEAIDDLSIANPEKLESFLNHVDNEKVLNTLFYSLSLLKNIAELSTKQENHLKEIKLEEQPKTKVAKPLSKSMLKVLHPYILPISPRVLSPQMLTMTH